ncbi:MAG: polyphosphate kinase 2 family protein [Pirellulales bacterium]|nr:polyphosphate kinase 2 family protein [Pirellulales bacterium]
MSQPLTVPPGKRIRLKDFDPAWCGGEEKRRALAETQRNVQALGELAYRLYAENRRALLIVLQGMDTSGKDGTIRTVMDGINPQSCQVTSFKAPSEEELDHDFLWRIHRAVPRRGNVGIFNRSHYEDVLVVRVRGLVPEKEWQSRYDRINEFERLLCDGGVRLVKFFLHISKEEQRQRLQARLDDPTKRWKFSRRDLEERKLWAEYQRAYEDALTRCNTPHAPWYIIPSDRKWYRNLTVSRVLRQVLEEMDPQFPPPEPGLKELTVE